MEFTILKRSLEYGQMLLPDVDTDLFLRRMGEANPLSSLWIGGGN